MTKDHFADDLQTLLRGRFPYIYVVSWEEDRVTDQILELNENPQSIGTKRDIYSWTVTQGLIRDPWGPSPELVCRADHQKQGRSHSDLALRTLDHIAGVQDPAIFVLKDFHIFLGDTN